MERISVIVPIYKVEAYLDRCVQSIVAQTYTNLEIILVDDGSPDNCPAICDTWAEKDARIKVVHKENGGLSDARNAGLAVATGDLISFIDSDDTIEPKFLELLYGALTACGADVAECGVSYVDEQGTLLRVCDTADVIEMGKVDALRRLVLEDGIYQTVWNKLYRRKVMNDILFAFGKYNEDEFWTYRVFDRMEKLAVVREPLYNYLQRGTSIIGVGYNIRRLDGLEARFQRMEYLHKYEGLAVLTRQQFVVDCMWHLQCAMRLPEESDREKAQNQILSWLEETPAVQWTELTLSAKYRLWYKAFLMTPIFVSKLRNRLRIGL